MAIYQILSAVGPDKTGIVAQLSKILFQNGCNLEDSSMMRLGSEFGVLLIFTTKKPLKEDDFIEIKKMGLTFQLKTISKKLASSIHEVKAAARVILHGYDQPGIVFRVSRVLSDQGFNITDLATHRTSGPGRSGYLLFIEGELTNAKSFKPLERKLTSLAESLGVTIRLTAVPTASL